MNSETPSQTFAKLCEVATPEVLRRYLLQSFVEDCGSFPAICVYSYFLTSGTPLWSPIPDPCEGASNEISSYVLKVLFKTAKKDKISHGTVYKSRFEDEPDRPELLRIDSFVSDEPRPENPEDIVFVRALDKRFEETGYLNCNRDLFVFHKFWACSSVRQTEANGELVYVGAPKEIEYPF